MNIWLTSYIHDGELHAGPNIAAIDRKKAKLICTMAGLVLVGELEMIIDSEMSLDEFEIDQDTVIH